LEGKAALVVGAGSGIGRGCAEACAAEGASVMVADIDEAGGNETVAGIRSHGGTGHFISTDITDEKAVQGAVEATVAEFGKLDVLMTSAGGKTGDWHAAIDLYLKGPYYANKHAVDQMERNGGGAIVNIASINGLTGFCPVSPDQRPGDPVMTVEQTGYPCAKHAVIALTRVIAVTYAKKNIRANAICPGYIRTGMTQFMYAADDEGLPLINEALRVPLGRWGDPPEIGKVAAFLASDEASFISGQPIIVDGGYMAV
jgi:NAD(P)-dependent dehydrogenase (short-subunit alcohol dehydrogenase family)